MLQTLRRITRWGNADSFSSGYHYRENAISEKHRFHHSDLQNNHDADYNFTTIEGRQTSATHGSTTAMDNRNVLVNDNARNSATRHSQLIFTQMQCASTVSYDSVNANTMHSQQIKRYPKPLPCRSLTTPGSTCLVGKRPSRPEQEKLLQRIVVDGHEPLQQNHDDRNTTSRCKPTNIQFKFPQMIAKRHSSSEIL